MPACAGAAQQPSAFTSASKTDPPDCRARMPGAYALGLNGSASSSVARHRARRCPAVVRAVVALVKGGTVRVDTRSYGSCESDLWTCSFPRRCSGSHSGVSFGAMAAHSWRGRNWNLRFIRRRGGQGCRGIRRGFLSGPDGSGVDRHAPGLGGAAAGLTAFGTGHGAHRRPVARNRRDSQGHRRRSETLPNRHPSLGAWASQYSFLNEKRNRGLVSPLLTSVSRT